MTDNKKTEDSKFNIFDLPLPSGEVKDESSFYDYITFKNIVIILAITTFLIFLAKLASVQVAFLCFVLFSLCGIILFENSSRRRWEENIINQMDRMSSDYERLVRQVARNRNDNEQVRKKISDAAGEFVKNYNSSKASSEQAIERRMVKNIAKQLQEINKAYASNEDVKPEKAVSNLLPSFLDGEDTFKGMDDNQVGKTLTDDQVIQLINSAVKRDSVDLFLQPIVNLPQRKTRFYETFARIRVMPDIYLPASRYLGLAIERDLMPVIDNLLLLRGLQEVSRTAEGDYHRAYFFNITSVTLNDQKFMGDLVEFISQNRTLAPKIIFELSQEDLALMHSDILASVDGLSSLGCRFSMDGVESISFDFAYLEARHIRFVKIPASLLVDELDEESGLSRLKRLKSDMDHSGIDLIVEKIEKEKQLLELLDIDIDYGQGYLFGKPIICEGI